MRSLYLALALTATLVGPLGARSAAAQVCITPDAAECDEDGDPCTTDHCVSGTCVHESVPDRVTCDSVLDAFRRTIGLGAFVTDLAALVPTEGVPDSTRFVIDGALVEIAADLAAASRALAGRGIPPPSSGVTLSQSRARAAFEVVRVTRLRVRTLIQAFASSRGSLGPVIGDDLARRARFLYRSTTQLKRELRRLQRVSGVFAR